MSKKIMEKCLKNDKSKGRSSAAPELHDAAWMSVHSIQSSATSKQLLAKDLMLLLYGIRASVLVDYISPKSMTKDLLAVINRGKSIREEFNLLRLAQMCEGTIILYHLLNLSARLAQSIDSNLTDYLFIDCSASLARPTLLTRSATDSLLLPAFRAVLQLLLAGTAGGGDGVLHLHGEESGAPLPTLGGWLLEYPVIYYVAGAPGPHRRTRAPPRAAPPPPASPARAQCGGSARARLLSAPPARR